MRLTVDDEAVIQKGKGRASARKVDAPLSHAKPHHRCAE